MKHLNLILLLLAVTFLFSCGSRSNGSTSEPEGLSLGETVIEEWEDCPKCSGRGYFSHNCSGCDGDGRQTLTISRTTTRSCTTCGGIGKVPCYACQNYGDFDCPSCLGGKVKCTECGGAGKRVVRFDDEMIFVDCPYCKGSGYIPCQECWGDSRIRCRECNGQGNKTCPTCHGTGGPDVSYTEKIDEGKCPVCDGSGKIKERCEECDGEGRIKVEQ